LFLDEDKDPGNKKERLPEDSLSTVYCISE
jgi:hypothetical protein